MKEALKVLSELVSEGVIEDYAIGGALGATFYLEPVVTLDLDVFVLFNDNTDNTSLVPLQPIYEALRVLSAEHLAAISVQTGRPKDKLRVHSFLDWEGFDLDRFVAA